jgi:hypothetical protein
MTSSEFAALLAHAHQAAEQLQRVDGLRQQHAAATALARAAAGLVVVAHLGTPPGNTHGGELHRAQCFLLQEGAAR